MTSKIHISGALFILAISFFQFSFPTIPTTKMRLLQTTLFSLVGLSVLGQSLDDFIAKEGPIAKVRLISELAQMINLYFLQDNLLANIGPNGAKSAGAAPGIVIASPSTEEPNYLFTWVRDSSLVFKHIIDEYGKSIIECTAVPLTVTTQIHNRSRRQLERHD